MPTVEQARAFYTSEDAVHDFEHVLRVYHTAMKLGKEEGADLEILSGGRPAARFARRGTGRRRPRGTPYHLGAFRGGSAAGGRLAGGAHPRGAACHPRAPLPRKGRPAGDDRGEGAV